MTSLARIAQKEDYLAYSLQDISIVIPVYNGQETLVRCLNSLSDIRSEVKEVVVVDDGSSDKTPEIATFFVNETGGKVKYIRLSSNQGSARARNAGIMNSSGELLVFLDADDEIIPGELRESLRDFDEDADLLVGGALFLDSQSRQVLREEVFLPEGRNPEKEVLLDYLLQTRCFWRVMYRRDLIVENGISFFPTKVQIGAPFFNLDDYFFQLEVLLHTNTIAVSNKSFYKYYLVPSDRKRYHEQSEFFHLGYEMLLSRFELSRLHRSFAQDHVRLVFGSASEQLIQCAIEVRGFNTLRLSSKILRLLARSPITPTLKIRRSFEGLFSFAKVNFGIRSKVRRSLSFLRDQPLK